LIVKRIASAAPTKIPIRFGNIVQFCPVRARWVKR
jgi:hypothetical protein